MDERYPPASGTSGLLLSIADEGGDILIARMWKGERIILQKHKKEKRGGGGEDDKTTTDLLYQMCHIASGLRHSLVFKSIKPTWCCFGVTIGLSCVVGY